MGLLCKKFEDLTHMLSKQKPYGAGKGFPRQDIVFYECKKTEHYAGQCQFSTELIVNCTYCGKYGHTINSCQEAGG